MIPVLFLSRQESHSPSSSGCPSHQITQDRRNGLCPGGFHTLLLRVTSCSICLPLAAPRVPAGNSNREQGPGSAGSLCLTPACDCCPEDMGPSGCSTPTSRAPGSAGLELDAHNTTLPECSGVSRWAAAPGLFQPQCGHRLRAIPPVLALLRHLVLGQFCASPS